MTGKSTENALSFYQENTFDRDKWFKVAAVDYIELCKLFDFPAFFQSTTHPCHLLDIGCGTGKFPQILHPHLHNTQDIIYDYLDPSEYSLKQTKNFLKPPYMPRTAYQTIAEDIILKNRDAVPTLYDMIWTIHSAYYLQRNTLAPLLNGLVKKLRKDTSVFMVYLDSKNSSYHEINALEKELLPEKGNNDFVWAEDIDDILRNSHGDRYTCTPVTFAHTISQDDEDILERYLQQCTLSDITLSAWRAHSNAGKWLEEKKSGKAYNFSQTVMLMQVRG